MSVCLSVSVRGVFQPRRGPPIYQGSYWLRVLSNYNSRKHEQIFMKFGTKFLPLGSTPISHFSVSYSRKYQRDGCSNLWNERTIIDDDVYPLSSAVTSSPLLSSVSGHTDSMCWHLSLVTWTTLYYTHRIWYHGVIIKLLLYDND
jgi:hypothetical protein